MGHTQAHMRAQPHIGCIYTHTRRRTRTHKMMIDADYNAIAETKPYKGETDADVVHALKKVK